MKKGIMNKEWTLNNGINPYLGPGGCLNEVIVRVFYKQLGNDNNDNNNFPIIYLFFLLND